MFSSLVTIGLLPDPAHIDQTLVDEITNAIFLIGVLAIIAFTVLYTARSRWYLTPAGRSVWATFVSFTLLLVDIFVSRWIGHDYPARDWLRMVPYTLLTASLVYMLAVLLMSLRSSTQILGSETKQPKTGPIPTVPPSNKAL